MIDQSIKSEYKFGVPSIGMPAEILFNINLTPTDQKLFGFIRNLSQSSKGCWASNAFLAELLFVNPQTISNSVAKLKKYQYIYVENETRKNITTRRIFINKDYPKIYEELTRYVHDCLLTETKIDQEELRKKCEIYEETYPPISPDIPPYTTTLNKDVSKDVNKNVNESKDSYKRFSEKSVPKKSRRTRNNSEHKSMKQKIQEKAKLKSSVNKSVNKSISYESTANIQLIEYWNSQDNLRTHKISADSKTYRNTLKKLQLLRTGQLHKNIDFKNAPINGTPVELFSKKFKKSEIAKAIKNLNNWCKEGNYPVKKDWIKRLSLADAIFCVQYGSPLLSAFHKGVQPVVDPVQKLKTDTEKKAYAKLEFFFASRNGSSGTSLRTREQIVELIQSLKGLREQNAGNWNLYDPSMYGWGRSPNDVFSLVLDYIDFLKGENFKSDFEPNRNLSPIGLKIGGLAWKKFEKSYRDRFGVDVITGPAN